MSEIHQIGELLRSGAKPSQEEAEQLSELGAFVAAMYGRYLHGTGGADVLTSRTDSFAAAVGGRLGAETSTRWEQGLGISEQLLSSEWGGWWQVASRGFSAGYDLDAFDFERATLELYDEAKPVVAAADAPATRRRRGSLFGPKATAGRATRRAPADVRRAALAGSPPSRRAAASSAGAARWIDGGLVELATLEALERGGLYIADQVAATRTPVTGAARRGLDGTAPQAAPRRSTLLDGLLVDDRTPALSSALQWAEAVYGQRAIGDGLAVNADRIAAMTSVSAGTLDSGRGTLQRPVYAFFDAVQGDFLSLESESASASPVTAKQTPTAVPTRRPSMFGGTTSEAGAPSHAARSLQSVRPGLQRVAGPSVATMNIDRIVRATGRAANSVRPYTNGVFPNVADAGSMAQAGAASSRRDSTGGRPAAGTTSAPSARGAVAPMPSAYAGAAAADLTPIRLATQVTYTRGGAPQARVQRASSAAPRVSVMDLVRKPRGVEGDGGAPTIGARAEAAPVGEITRAIAPAMQPMTAMGAAASPTWRLVSDLGPDLPLGATLGRNEIFGATAGTYTAPQTLVERSGFLPNVARGAGVQQGFGSSVFTSAVDGVVWVAPEPLDAPTAIEAATARMPLSLVPRGRAATMVPAARAMEFGAVAANASERTAANAAAMTMTAPSARPLAATLDTPSIAQLAAPRDTEHRIAQALRSGTVPTAQQFGAADLAMVVSQRFDAPGTADASRADSALRSGGIGGQVTPETTARLAASGAAPSGATEVSRGTLSRWLDQVVTTSSAPTRNGAGAYTRFDAPREMLGLFDAAAPDASVAAGESISASGRTSTRQRATRPIAAPATQAAVERLITRATGRAASATVPTAQAAATQVAAVARHALQRPVTTAREARAVTPLIDVLAQAQVQMSAMSDTRARSIEPVLARQVFANAARSNELAGTSSRITSGTLLEQLAGLGSDESRAVMQTLRSAGWTGADLEMLTLSGEGAIDAVTAETAPASRHDAVVKLRAINREIAAARGSVDAARPVAATQLTSQSGEATSLAMPIVSSQARLAPAAMTLAATTPAAMTPAAMSATTVRSEATSASQMGRNLARILSGTEALGAPVSAAQVAPSALSAIASVQAASFMPILAGATGDSYFGVTAPERTAGRAMRVSGLRDAVGELVTMAKELAAASDTTVEGNAGRRAVGRLAETRARLDSRSPVVRASVARVLAAGSNERELVSALARVPATERAEALALARANAPQIIARLEQSVASGASYERGLVELITGRGLPTIGVDAARSDVATPGQPGSSRVFGALDATYVQQAGDGTPEAAGSDAGAGIGERVASALRASTRGPAGARRLLQPLGRPVDAARAQGMRAADRKALSIVDASVPTDLASVMAPEAMLSGLRSHELSQAMTGLASAQAYRGEAPGVFATLADSGVDMSSPTATVLGDSAPKAARGRVSGGERGRLLGEIARATGPERMGATGPADAAVKPQRGGNLFKSDPVQVLLQLAGRDPVAAERAFSGGDSGMSRRGRAGLFSAIMRGADRREVASLFQQAGASDFAFSWLARVDGTRSGLDLGMGGTRTEMGRAFGSRRVSTRIAGESAMQDASLVSAADGPSRGDRSGLRSLAAHASPTRGGGSRPGPGASAALRRTDWRFVETGSRAQTTHADLGKLASAIVSNNQASARTPLPLIAPAAKAVAQTALRSPTSEARPGRQNKSQGSSGGEGAQNKSQSGLTEQALDQLAIEMASRVAQIMGRNKERIGVWH